MGHRVALIVSAVALAAAGCSSSTPCSASNCSGCCDTSGKCQQGSSTAACGAAGSACVQCSALQSCQSGACQLPRPAFCDSTNCAGCCQGTTCIPVAQQTNQCGSGGAACSGCGGSTQSCQGGVCVSGCGPGNCQGCCSGTTCLPPAAESVLACGVSAAGGSACIGCALGQSCTGGVCAGGPGDGGNPDGGNGGCTQSASDVSGTWLMSFDNTLWGRWTTSLSQSGGAVSGSYFATTFSGRVTLGSLSGNTLNLDVTSPGCEIKLTGTLQDGCHMKGTGICVGYSTANFTATRGECGQCPSGFACNAQGSCAGGNVDGLALDVPTATVSGTITLNGAAPQATAACSAQCSGMALVHFEENTYGYSYWATVPCSGNTFSATLYPGTYTVSVIDDGNSTTFCSNLPSNSTAFVAATAMAVTGNLSGINLDVPTAAVSGTITLNGAVPQATAACSAQCSGMALVHFVENTHGYSYWATVPCSANTFSATLYPGTYTVSVIDDGNSTTFCSNLPSNSTAFVANTALAVNGPLSNVHLDVPTATVGGTITLNGAAPQATAACPAQCSGMALVHFVENTHGYSSWATVPCSANTFSATLYPGTYTASVIDDGNSTTFCSNLPSNSTAYVANTALAVNGSVNGVNLNVPTATVSGAITLNGAAPQATTACVAQCSGMALVHFVENAHGYSYWATVPCSANTFSATLYPGTYTASVIDDGNSTTFCSNLPSNSTAYVANTALTANGVVNGVVLDVPTATVSGTITLNGAAPQPSAACAASCSGMALVNFLENSRGYSYWATVPCSGNTFSATLYPGTYTASVIDDGNSTTFCSNLPSNSTAFVANTALTVSGVKSGVNLDVPTVAVGGTVTLNGAAIQPTAVCAAQCSGESLIEFLETRHGYRYFATTPCGSNAFSATLYPGSYRVSVLDDGNSTTFCSNLPSNSTSYVVVDSIQL